MSKPTGSHPPGGEKVLLNAGATLPQGECVDRMALAVSPWALHTLGVLGTRTGPGAVSRCSQNIWSTQGTSALVFVRGLEPNPGRSFMGFCPSSSVLSEDTGWEAGVHLPMVSSYDCKGFAPTRREKLAA